MAAAEHPGPSAQPRPAGAEDSGSDDPENGTERTRARHSMLDRQLRRLDLDATTTPDGDQWIRFLERVEASYEEADHNRYLSERSTELVSAEMRLLNDRISAEKQNLQAVIASLADGILGLDPDGRVVLANPAALRLLGRTEEEVVGRPVGVVLSRMEYTGGRPVPIGTLVTRAVQRGEPWAFDTGVLRTDETARNVTLAVTQAEGASVEFAAMAPAPRRHRGRPGRDRTPPADAARDPGRRSGRPARPRRGSGARPGRERRGHHHRRRPPAPVPVGEPVPGAGPGLRRGTATGVHRGDGPSGRSAPGGRTVRHDDGATRLGGPIRREDRGPARPLPLVRSRGLQPARRPGARRHRHLGPRHQRAHGPGRSARHATPRPRDDRCRPSAARGPRTAGRGRGGPRTHHPRRRGVRGRGRGHGRLGPGRSAAGAARPRCPRLARASPHGADRRPAAGRVTGLDGPRRPPHRGRPAARLGPTGRWRGRPGHRRHRLVRGPRRGRRGAHPIRDAGAPRAPRPAPRAQPPAPAPTGQLRPADRPAQPLDAARPP